MVCTLRVAVVALEARVAMQHRHNLVQAVPVTPQTLQAQLLITALAVAALLVTRPIPPKLAWGEVGLAETAQLAQARQLFLQHLALQTQVAVAADL
jgi:hypothetical protein